MPSTEEPALTIQKRGSLSLNSAAFEALGSPKHVELLFNQDERLIGIRKTTAAMPHAYPIRGVGKNEATHVVSGKAFLGYYGIPRDVARRWIAKKQDDMLVVDLKEQGTEVTGHSNRAHKVDSG